MIAVCEDVVNKIIFIFSFNILRCILQRNKIKEIIRNKYKISRANSHAHIDNKFKLIDSKSRIICCWESHTKKAFYIPYYNSKFKEGSFEKAKSEKFIIIYIMFILKYMNYYKLHGETMNE